MNEADYERRQSVADLANEAYTGVKVLASRFETHDRTCTERYRSLQGWLKSTFFTLLSALGFLVFYMLTRGRS